MEFTATLELHGRTATGIEVPAEVVEALGGGRRPAVVATLGGYDYRTTVGTRGGRFLIPVSAEHRAAAAIAAGEQVTVGLVLDTAPREVEVPDDLAAAIAAQDGAQAAFDALSFSVRKEHARSVASAKAPETRERRIAKVLDALA